MSSTLEAAESAMATAILSGTAQDRDRAVKRLAMAANQNGVEISRSYTTQLREAIEAANAGNDPELQEAIKASLVGVRVPEESGHVPLSMEDVEPGMAVMVTSDTAVYEASFTGVEDIIPQVLNQYTEPAHRSRQRLGEQGVVVKLDTKRRTVKVKLDSDEAEVWFTPGSLYIASAREISVRSQDQGLPGQPSSEEWWVYLRNDQFGEWNIRCDPTPDATVVGGIAQGGRFLVGGSSVDKGWVRVCSYEGLLSGWAMVESNEVTYLMREEDAMKLGSPMCAAAPPGRPNNPMTEDEQLAAAMAASMETSTSGSAAESKWGNLSNAELDELSSFKDIVDRLQPTHNSDKVAMIVPMLLVGSSDLNLDLLIGVAAEKRIGCIFQCISEQDEEVLGQEVAGGVVLNRVKPNNPESLRLVAQQIDECRNKEQGVLVTSPGHDLSGAGAVATVFLMHKYGWSYMQSIAWCYENTGGALQLDPGLAEMISKDCAPKPFQLSHFCQACLGCRENKSAPVRDFLNQGGDPRRKLSNDEVLELRPHGSNFVPGHSLGDIAARHQHWGLISLIAGTPANANKHLLKRLASQQLPEAAAQVREAISGQLVRDERLPGWVLGCYEALPTLSLSARALEKQEVAGQMIDQDITRTLAVENCINHNDKATKLYPIYTAGDGNCLLHAAAIATWGVHDRDQLLRTALHKTMAAKPERLMQYWQKAFKAKTLSDYGYEVADTDAEWDYFVQRAGTRGHSLETTHVFLLSQVLRRPIIVYGVSHANDMFGGMGQKAFFQGIYLPLLWAPEECSKNPITIAYTPGHFTALAPVYSPDPTLLALQTSTGESLPLQFADSSEFPSDAELQAQYLHVTQVDGQRFGVRQSCEPPEILDTLVELLYKALDAGVNDAPMGADPDGALHIDPEAGIKRLVDLGFGKDQAEFALSASAGDVDAAMNLLLNQ